MTTTAATAPDPDARPCPRWGYDLRAATTDRCSECGLAFDRAAAATSAVPWAHRKRLGRWWAFLRTAWWFTLDRKRIRHEAARPHDPADAGRFRWWAAACAALGLALLFAVARDWHVGARTESASTLFAGPCLGTPMSGTAQDLTLPWSVGAAPNNLSPLYLLGLAVHLTGAGRRAAGAVRALSQ